MENKKLNITLYTDGACSGNPGAGGWAYILMYKDKIKKGTAGYKRTTNNRMELLAVIEGLSQLKLPCAVNIYTDSQYIVNAFNQNWIWNWHKNGWKRKKDKLLKNADLWKRLFELAQTHSVTFNWVKGHSSNEFNNECDLMAVKAYKFGELLEDANFNEFECEIDELSDNNYSSRYFTADGQFELF